MATPKKTVKATETTPASKRPAARKPLLTAVNPSAESPPGGEPQIAGIPQTSPAMFAKDRVEETADEEADIRSTPTQHAIAGEMFNVITGHGRMTLSNAAVLKLKVLSENNDRFFLPVDVAHQLLLPFIKDHPNFEDVTALAKFAKQVGHGLNQIARRPQRGGPGGTDKVFISTEKVHTAFESTPCFSRIAFGYRWGPTSHMVSVATPPVEKPAIQAAIEPVPTHVDIDGDTRGAQNSQTLQEMIMTMDRKQCNECLKLLLDRSDELHDKLIKAHKILLANSYNELH